MYRSLYPDQATVEEMKKMLKENEIDFNELVEYRMENCKFGDWTAEGDTGVRKWTQPSAILNSLDKWI